MHSPPKHGAPTRKSERFGIFRLCIWCALLFGAMHTGLSQIPYSFRNLNIKDGLSQSSALSVHQDKSGFMWIGTYDGLNRYDGRNFINFMPSANSRKSIMGGTIYAIAEDNDGLLYFGTYGQGLSVFEPQTAVFTHFQETDSLAGGTIPSNFINAMRKDTKGNIWIASRAGISIYSPSNKSFTHYLASNNLFPPYSAIDILFDAQQKAWIATNGGGLCRFDDTKGKFIQIPNKSADGDKHKINNIHKIAPHPQGGILISTRGGVFLFDPVSSTYKLFAGIGYNTSIVFVDSRKHIWIGSMDKPLIVIAPDQTVTTVENNRLDPSSLPETYVETIYEDRKGDLWFGLKTNGISVANLSRKPFLHLFNDGTGNCLPSNEVYAVEAAPDGSIWFGTMNGIAKWNRTTNKYQTFTTKNSKISSSQIWDLQCQGDDSLWIAGDEGLHLFLPNSNLLKSYYHIQGDTTSLCSNDITNLEIDHRGQLWVGTSEGLSRMDKRTGKFRNYFKNNGNKLSYNVIWHILSDSKKRLWVGTEDGLNLYDPATESFKTYHYDPKNNRSLINNDVSSLRESPNGTLWVATRSGVCRYNEATDDFDRIVLPEFANVFSYSAFEIEGKLWVSTNKGLARIGLADKSVVFFTEDDGIQSNEFNPPGLLMSDGQLFFGGINGVTAFYPNQIKIDTTYAPPIFITKLSIDYDLIETGKEVHNHKIFKQIEFAKRLVLDYDEKLLSLGFSALDYTLPQKINYFYRILPESKEWVALKNQNYVTFINLQPGHYQIQIRSTNSDGVDVENTRSLELIIRPPFWRTWWFLTIISIVTTFLVVVAIRYRFVKLHQNNLVLESQVLERTKKIEVQKRQIEIQRNIANHQRDKIAQQRDELELLMYNLEEKVKERTKELEQAKTKAEESDKLKSAFLSNMSHEIRTPLNAIIGFSELLLHQEFEQKEKESFAEIIKTNGDHLLNLLNDIIDVSMIEAGQLTLHTKRVDVNELLFDVWLSFKNHRMLKAKNGDVELILHPLPASLVLQTDPLRLKQILYNLISNAIKFTERGTVEMECVVLQNFTRFSVKDSGIGISAEHQKHIFERFRKVGGNKRNLYGGFGLGLTISRNLVESLGGKIWVESVPQQGTTFFFTLPLGNSTI